MSMARADHSASSAWPLKGIKRQTYNKIGILNKSNVCLYGTWGPLGGCKILPWGVGIIPPLADTFLKKMCLVKHVQAVFLIWSGNGFRTNNHMFTCISQSDTTNMTVWHVISYYIVREQTQFLEEA